MRVGKRTRLSCYLVGETGDDIVTCCVYVENRHIEVLMLFFKKRGVDL